ncbi:hypothetical protein Cgig2_016940 [Carnegiea gigantea]|uniref:Uncharacterized protein n=1 Tax=Carnegiea gigantea TaxID=171969 RepID=A0A9Q1JQA2_9CARY|nr:hypothetical protein Cgig2_016940 [Carnegiea gigantea]
MSLYVFSRLLTTDEIALYVLGNFEWYRREVMFPPGPLSYDYRELWPTSIWWWLKSMLRTTRSLSCPRWFFMAMLLNDVVKFDVLSGWMISVMESALKELQWNAFQSWTGRNRGRIMEARRQEGSSDSDEEPNPSSYTPMTPTFQRWCRQSSTLCPG